MKKVLLDSLMHWRGGKDEIVQHQPILASASDLTYRLREQATILKGVLSIPINYPVAG